MSQVNSAGAKLNSTITPWNRTPGKPGTGTAATGPLSSNRWPTNNNTTNKAVSGSGSEVKIDNSLEEGADTVPSASCLASDSGQMWPPPIFNSSRLPDPSATAFAANSESTVGNNQWSVPTFSGPIGANSLLVAPGSTTPPNAAWTNSSSSSVPRAITGQQQTHHSNPTADPDYTSRYLTGTSTNAWPIGTDSSDLLTDDDRSHISLALSKLKMIDSIPATGCFQPIQDFSDSQLIPSNLTANPKPRESLTDSNSSHKTRKKSSIDSAEVEALFASDPEEMMRSVVNTTEPWGLNPVDQSTPWDTSELLNDSSAHPGASVAGSPPLTGDVINPASRGQGAHSSSIYDGPNSSVPQQRRIGNLNSSSIGRELESNVWSSEPPTGTGIWESHYENLGERTARWQQNISSGTNPTGFPSHPSVPHPAFVSASQPGSRAHLPSGSDNASMFRGFTRPNPGMFPSGPLTNTGGTRPMLPTPHMVGSSTSSNGSSRGFPLSNSPNVGGPWPFPTPNDTSASGASMVNKNRWPNTSFNRMPGKQQPSAVPHMLSTQNGSGMRWPPMNNVTGGWPMNDPRRSNIMQTGWTPSPSGDTAGYFGQPPQMLPSRIGPPGSVATDFTTPVIPPPRGGAGTPGSVNQQPFRPPHSAFYPTMNSGFSPSPSSTSSAHRMFLSPQQHSQQLQQQSVLRANAMRQLINLGFPDEEVQAIFSDINTNVERALMDLRDRTGHPGLDEIIKSMTSSGLMPMGNMDDGLGADQLAGVRPLTMRSIQPQGDQPLSKSSNIPNENLELSLQMLQQRETQILQTIMQLHSKHQELTQRLGQLRTTNLSFASNSVLQELQMQAVQVASQIEAQSAQLRHVRGQAGMLKQITVSTSLTQPQQTASSNPMFNNTSAFNLLSSAAWPPGTPSAPAMGGGFLHTQQQQQHMSDAAMGLEQTLDVTSAHDQNLKMGSSSFLWESGPWSGSGPRNSNDPYSSSADKRWSSTFPNRPPYGALGDPRWTDMRGGDVGANNGANLLLSDSQRSTGNLESSSGADGNGKQRARWWLLVHNIPPHVSVGVLKLAVSAALAKHAKAMGNDKFNEAQPDIELHPNMSARWVLLGLSTSSEASAVHECLESPGGEQNGAHYGSIKAITPSEAYLRLQDIQSLASRFKGLGTDLQTPSAISNSRSVSQSNPMHNFAGAAANNDQTGATQDSTTSMINSTDPT